MAIAGTLTVNILAKTLGFGKGIGRARKDLRGFNKDVSGTSKLMGGLRTTIAGIFGGLTVRAGFNFLKNQLEMADALGKTAETLDLTTGELGQFQLAAKLAGVDSRQLNISIQRMSRRIGEAALGGGELSKTLTRLRLDAKALSKLAVADQFLAMGEALTSITNQDEQLAAIFKTFDSEGVAVFRAFKRMEQARLAFKRFNLELKNADSRELAKIADEATIIKEVFGIRGRKFLIDIGPDVLRALDRVQDLFAPRPADKQQLGESALEFAKRQKKEKLQKEPFPTEKLPGESTADFVRRRQEAISGGTFGGGILRDFKKFWKGETELQRLISHELVAGGAFKDTRNLPFGPIKKDFATPGLITKAADQFNQAVFLEPARQIVILLNQIAGNTKTVSDDVTEGDF